MNELNKSMKVAVESYCIKNNIQIESEGYGTFYYQAFIGNNERITCNVMENKISDRKLPNFYMKRITNNKQKRIPKTEW